MIIFYYNKEHATLYFYPNFNVEQKRQKKEELQEKMKISNSLQ